MITRIVRTPASARSRLFACLAALLFCFNPHAVYAQDYTRIAPKLPAKTAPPALSAPSVSTAELSAPTFLIPLLKGLVFVAGRNQLSVAGVSVSAAGPSGINVLQCPELNDQRFKAAIAPLIGRPLTLADLEHIQTETTVWLRAHQRPFVDVSTPPQNVANGIIQIVVTEYKLGQVKVKGARYFSPALIKSTSGLQSDQPIRLDDLQTDLDRLNRNPFLNVDAVFQPGASTGITDVTLNAKDQLPIRVYSGFDNLGARSLGTTEYNFGANWGNVFGTAQILSYQFTQTFTGRSTSHSISDTIPLPWGDQLLIFGSYGEQRPNITQIFNDLGHSGQASIRYVRPLPRAAHGFTQDLQFGFDFKTTDNNLAFAGMPVFAGQAEVDQFPITYEAELTDRLGHTAIQNLFVYSPGNLTPANTTAALSTLVPGSTASYLYNRFLITRTMPLPKGLSSITRVTFQESDHNLPYSEQVGGGGVGSVRGYYTDTALGSEGEMVSQELRLPPFGVSRLLDKGSELQDKAQFGAFFDYADLRQVNRIPDIANPIDLASAGLLARCSLSRSLDFQFDLGWRLRAAPTVPERGAYGQVSLTASF